jgi:ABC-type Mn2+/Zn2+ transport system permease subunit
MHAQEHSTFREGVVTGLLGVPGVVAGYTVLHFVVYILVGALLALLTHTATHDISLRMGVWMGLVCAFCLLAGLTYMLAVATSERLPLWTVLGGSFLGVAVMGWYLLARHPEVRDTGKALGDEVDVPPHPRRRMV